MRQTMLSEDGENIFQKTKRKTAEAANRGVKIIKLSIGQPQGPALFSARQKAAEAILSDETAMHGYQDNGERGAPGFSKRFVQIHVKTDLSNYKVEFLPIVGIKPTILQTLLACNCFKESIKVGHMTSPGYPVPKTVCGYLKIRRHYSLRTDTDNQFLFDIEDIEKGTKVLMLNIPHNPSGRMAIEDWWHILCAYCEDKGIRIVNDGAYHGLSHNENSSTLADVAIDYPHLSWVELYSASKPIGNATGWRIGAAVGSPKFIENIGRIKGNIDSGFCAALAKGVLAAVERDKIGMLENRKMYKNRLDVLINILNRQGMRLAVYPDAGFFTLWKLPAYAFDRPIENSAQFNELMIEKTGVIGVPFEGISSKTGYTRYAVAASDVIGMSDEIAAAFAKANVAY